MSTYGSVMPTYAAASFRQGQARAASRMIDVGDYRAMVVMEEGIEVDVPSLPHHILVLAQRFRPIMWTDLSGRKRQFAYRRGDVVLIPAGCPAWFSSRDMHGEVLHVHLDPSAFDEAKTGINLAGSLEPLVAVGDPLLQHIGEALVRAIGHVSPHEHLYQQSLGVVLARRLGEVAGVAKLPRQDARAPTLAPWKLKQVLELLRAGVDAELNLYDLAAHVGLSSFHFARAFKAATGLPPHRYLIQLRIEKARELLETTELPVGEIAAQVGYDDPSYLARLFRREVGMTPAAYRRERRG